MRSTFILTRPVDNAFLVRERDRRLLRDVLRGVAAVAVLGGSLLGYAWMHIETVRLGYRIDTLEKQLHQLHEGERQLRLEASYVAHPKRVAERAAEHLGLEPLRVDQAVFYERLAEEAP